MELRRSSNQREIKLENGVPENCSLPSNRISTGNHTLHGFLLTTMLLQFTRLSTVWFTFIALIGLNPLNLHYPSSSVPLILLLAHLFISMTKDGVAIARRNISDRRLNKEGCSVWTGDSFATVPCEDIRVGQCVLVYEKGRIPADVVLMATSSPDGSAYVSTFNILGENNLDIKHAVKELQRRLPNNDNPPSFNFHRLRAVARVNQPTPGYSVFQGKLKVQGFYYSSMLELPNFVLRGSVVHNTAWVLCMVVYTGMETKVWLDRVRAPRKSSYFLKVLNFWTIYTAAGVLVVSAALILIQYFASQEKVTGEDFIMYVWGLSSEIPVAMFIGLDIVRVALMWKFSRHNVGSLFKSGNMSEDLASITHVLMDKTGTLTENNIELLEVVVLDEVYSKFSDCQKPTLESCNRMETQQLTTAREVYPAHSEYSFADLREKMRASSDTAYRCLCECMCLCNSVIPLGKETYKATSADEKAIVQAARELGCYFVTRVEDGCSVEIFDSCLNYHVLAIRKFSPELRRMRVLIQAEFSPYATLYVKGAYAVLKDFLKLSPDDRLRLESHLEEMTHKGLRTMLLCCRRIEGEQLEIVKNQAQNIKLSKTNVEAKVEILLKDLEKELDYIGIAGLKDEVRADTKACLDTLRKSKIETIVVSGDSESNSLACAYSLSLIDSEVKVVSLRGIHSTELCAKRLFSIAREHLFHKEVKKSPVDTHRPYFQSSSLNWAEFNPDTVNFALSIDGITLNTALKEKITKHFLLCLLCASSFNCFNSLHPNHKRDIVKLLKTGLQKAPTLLTIGDDGSNVPMLLEADVGVGIISKKRENRAASNSDVAVSHFSVLSELLQRGRENSALLSQIALLFLYSTSILEIMKIAFMIASDITPSFLFSVELSIYYNTVTTLVTFVYIGITNTAPSERGHLSKPPVFLNLRSILAYLTLAMCHSLTVIVTVFPAFLVSDVTIGSTAEINIVILLALVLTVNQHCLHEIQSRRVFLLLTTIVSIGLTFLYFSLSGDEDLKAAEEQVIATPRLVIAVVLSPLSGAVVSAVFVRKERKKKKHIGKVVPFFEKKSFIRKLRSESRTAMEILQNSNMVQVAEIQESTNFELNQSWMRFTSPSVETNYISDFTQSNIQLIRTTIFLFCVQMAITIPYSSIEDQSVLPFLAFGCAAGLCLLISTWFHAKIIAVGQWFALVFLLLTFVVSATTKNLYELVYLSIPVGLLLIVKEKWLVSCTIVLVAFILLLIDSIVHYWLYEGAEDSSSLTEAVGTVVVQGLVSWVAVKVAYDCDKNSRYEYKLTKEAEDKYVQSENILSCLLPDFVRKRVKDGLRYIAEDKESVTVLFCEICDFDEISMSYSPGELVELLDDIFQKIDELCDATGVAKIETVGKVYMACTGLADFESEVPNDIQLIPHPQRALELSSAILSSFRLYKLQTGKPLRFKIGINTGPVIAGVVGYHKPQFSLVGDTVNTASRMCTTVAMPNTIQISSSTYASLNLQSTSNFIACSVFVKGKGEMTAYILDASTVLESPQPRRRTGSLAEETPNSFSRISTRQRSSIGTALRLSVDFGDAQGRKDKELIEVVRTMPWSCNETESELMFRMYIARRKVKRMKLGLGTYLVAFGVLASMKWAKAGTMGDYMYVVPGAIYTALLLFVLYLRLRLFVLYTSKWFSWLLVFFYSLTCLSIYLELVSDLDLTIDLATLIVCLLLVIMYYCSGIFFRHALVGSVLILVPWAAVCVFVQPGKWERAVFSVLFGVQHCVYMYFNEKNQRAFYNLSKVAAREIEKTERLLTQMLPVHAYESLKHDEWVTDKLLQVTVLYADISGFTAWSSVHSPQEVINHLSQIYSAFDKICVRLGVYKVHTIGDCYVAMSATNNSDARDPSEECQIMLSLAEEMVRVLSSLHSADNVKLNMRIGLHMGDVIAGITGTKLIRYDIYGSDVLIANKMESNSAEGRINVSSEVKDMLERKIAGFVEFQRNKEVEIAELGRKVECFFAKSVE